MDKPSVYIETTIVGHLTSRVPRDVTVAGQMIATRDWWQIDRRAFECFTSQVVLDEAARGDPAAAVERLQMLADVPLIRGNASSDMLANLLLSRGALPPKARYDAVHLAIAAVNGMSYLLTWNCRHLANATLRGKIERACRGSNVEPPIICTPVELRELRS
jgi:hypothetical protein